MSARVGEWVCLGATPIFALMALLTSMGAFETPHVHGSLVHGGSMLGGMAFMYLLMGLFHAAPWLRRLAAWRNAQGAAYPGGVTTGNSM